MLSTNIKENTKTAHQQLEKIVVQKLKAIRTNEDYADLLKHFYAYFSHIEQAIAPYINLQLLPDHAERRNSEYLKDDIEELGFDINELPFTTVPEIANTQQALGAMYVLEGSIMGGSIIVQMLAKGGITKGISFFSGYGSETGAMWAKFVAILNAAATTAIEEDNVINTANETFNKFGNTFVVMPAA